MHKAKTSRLPKIITSLLMVFGLIVGSAVVIDAPAQALTNGCINSGFQPQNCQSEKTPITDIIAITGATASTTATMPGTCAAATFTLNLATSSGLTPTAGPIAGLTFSTTGTTATLGGTTAGTLATTDYIIMGTCTADSSRVAFSFSVTVTATATPIILPATQTVTGTVGTALTSTATYAATNFTGGTVTYAINGATSLPAGLALNASTGVVTGTPTSVVTATVTVRATGVSNNAQTADATIAFTISAAPVTPAVEPPPPSRKVTICHRTHAVTNPYVRITVDYNSVNRKSGHQGHDEIFAGQHVFTAGIYVRAKDKLWGDIIPADPSGLNRWQPLNWTTLGAQIYNGTVAGCPSYDPVAFYNAQREAGVPEKKLKQEMADIEADLKEGNPGTSRVDPATLKYTGNNSSVAEQENDKVTICHRTHATTNPYVRITVSTSSVTNPAGHMEHDEIYDGHHVFDSAVTYPNNKKLWGDIIPADPTGKNRWQALNWTALGQSIYNGTTAGCGEQTLQQVYDKLREEGLPKKEIIDELEKQKNVDVDPKEIDELEYKGNDPETKKNEPKEPQDPNTAPTQSLSGQIWLDRNKDGLKDPDEPLMPNVEITLYKDGAPVGKIVTDKNGYFQFLDLTPGDYKVITTIPQDLDVTYDSEGLHQGEMNATVPTGGHTFTWAGLVGKTTIVEKQLLEEILKNNPKALPASEIPSWLKSKVAGKATPYKKPVLAATGSTALISLMFGLLLMLAGAGFSVATRKRR
jgi:hypothetical protein